MATQGLGVTSPAGDLWFTAEMSEKMTVPQHIWAGGEKSVAVSSVQDEDAFLRRRMNVPDRILLTGGERHEAGFGKPFELDIEQQLGPKAYDDKVLLTTPPSTLTLRTSQTPPAEPTMGGPEESRRRLDLVDEEKEPEWFRHMGLPYSPPGSGRPTHPLEELAALKRAVNDLKNRTAELEIESDYRTRRDFLLGSIAVVFIIVKAVRSFLL